MDGEIPIASSAAECKGLTTAGNEAATIASLQQQVAHLTAQLDITTRSSAKTPNGDSSGRNKEPDDDGTVAMDWEPWVYRFDFDNMDLGLGDHQEHSFINDAPLVEATPDLFSEVPQTWLPSSPDQITQNGPIFGEDYTAGLENDYNFDMPDINDQFNPSISLDICHTPIAIPGGNQGSSRDSEVYGVRARRTVLSVAKKTVLENWILDHTYPYPTKEDKEELSQLTELSTAQISSWFSRTRQRKLKRISHVDSHARMALEEADGHLEAWILPDSLFAKQGSWLNGGSLPNRPNSPIWNQPAAPRRSRSLPPRYTLDNVRYYVRNKARVAHNEEISLNVIHSDANEQDSATSQLGARLSFQRLGESPYLQQPDERSKNALIHRWLREAPDAHAESEALNSERSVDVDQLEAIPLPLARAPTPFRPERMSSLPSVRVSVDDMPRLDDRPPGDTQDLASVTGSAGPSIASGGSHGSFGSYRSFGSRRGRRIEFYRGQAEQVFSREPTRKRGLTEWDDQQRTKRRAGSVSLRASVELDACDLFGEEAEEGPKKYGCTFCESRFGRASSWKRHEESVHAPQKHWICAPLLSSQENSDLQCPICDKPFVTDTSEGQGCEHGFQGCWERAKEHRIFYRKDALRQHISIVHMKNSRLERELRLDDWVEEVDASGYDLKCYLCGHTNDDWHQRARHIISHFDNGETIEKWRIARDWRFFPPISITPKPSKEAMYVDPLPKKANKTPPNNRSSNTYSKCRVGNVVQYTANEHQVEGKNCGHIERDYCHRCLRPPNIYESLTRPIDEPGEEGIWPWCPVKESQFHELRNLYYPSWTRLGSELDWWCCLCRPGRWMSGDDWVSWEEHIMFTHGISCEMRPFPGPVEVRPRRPGIWEGLCASCCIWIVLTFDEDKDEVNWFRHAANCWPEVSEKG